MSIPNPPPRANDIVSLRRSAFETLAVLAYRDVGVVEFETDDQDSATTAQLEQLTAALGTDPNFYPPTWTSDQDDEKQTYIDMITNTITVDVFHGITNEYVRNSVTTYLKTLNDYVNSGGMSFGLYLESARRGMMEAVGDARVNTHIPHSLQSELLRICERLIQSREQLILLNVLQSTIGDVQLHKLHMAQEAIEECEIKANTMIRSRIPQPIHARIQNIQGEFTALDIAIRRLATSMDYAETERSAAARIDDIRVHYNRVCTEIVIDLNSLALLMGIGMGEHDSIGVRVNAILSAYQRLSRIPRKYLPMVLLEDDATDEAFDERLQSIVKQAEVAQTISTWFGTHLDIHRDNFLRGDDQFNFAIHNATSKIDAYKEYAQWIMEKFDIQIPNLDIVIHKQDIIDDAEEKLARLRMSKEALAAEVATERASLARETAEGRAALAANVASERANREEWKVRESARIQQQSQADRTRLAEEKLELERQIATLKERETHRVNDVKNATQQAFQAEKQAIESRFRQMAAELVEAKATHQREMDALKNTRETNRNDALVAAMQEKSALEAAKQRVEAELTREKEARAREKAELDARLRTQEETRAAQRHELEQTLANERNQRALEKHNLERETQRLNARLREQEGTRMESAHVQRLTEQVAEEKRRADKAEAEIEAIKERIERENRIAEAKVDAAQAETRAKQSATDSQLQVAAARVHQMEQMVETNRRKIGNQESLDRDTLNLKFQEMQIAYQQEATALRNKLDVAQAAHTLAVDTAQARSRLALAKLQLTEADSAELRRLNAAKAVLQEQEAQQRMQIAAATARQAEEKHAADVALTNAKAAKLAEDAADVNSVQRATLDQCKQIYSRLCIMDQIVSAQPMDEEYREPPYQLNSLLAIVNTVVDKVRRMALDRTRALESHNTLVSIIRIAEQKNFTLEGATFNGVTNALSESVRMLRVQVNQYKLQLALEMTRDAEQDHNAVVRIRHANESMLRVLTDFRAQVTAALTNVNVSDAFVYTLVNAVRALRLDTDPAELAMDGVQPPLVAAVVDIVNVARVVKEETKRTRDEWLKLTNEATTRALYSNTLGFFARIVENYVLWRENQVRLPDDNREDDSVVPVIIRRLAYENKEDTDPLDAVGAKMIDKLIQWSRSVEDKTMYANQNKILEQWTIDIQHVGTAIATTLIALGQNAVAPTINATVAGSCRPLIALAVTMSGLAQDYSEAMTTLNGAYDNAMNLERGGRVDHGRIGAERPSVSLRRIMDCITTANQTMGEIASAVSTLSINPEGVTLPIGAPIRANTCIQRIDAVRDAYSHCARGMKSILMSKRMMEPGVTAAEFYDRPIVYLRAALEPFRGMHEEYRVLVQSGALVLNRNARDSKVNDIVRTLERTNTALATLHTNLLASVNTIKTDTDAPVEQDAEIAVITRRITKCLEERKYTLLTLDAIRIFFEQYLGVTMPPTHIQEWVRDRARNLVDEKTAQVKTVTSVIDKIRKFAHDQRGVSLQFDALSRLLDTLTGNMGDIGSGGHTSVEASRVRVTTVTTNLVDALIETVVRVLGSGGAGRIQVGGGSSSSNQSFATSSGPQTQLTLDAFTSKRLVASAFDRIADGEETHTQTKIAVRVLIDFAKTVAGFLSADLSDVFKISTVANAEITKKIILRALAPGVPLVPARLNRGTPQLALPPPPPIPVVDNVAVTMHNATKTFAARIRDPVLESTARRWATSRAVWDELRAIKSADPTQFIESVSKLASRYIQSVEYAGEMEPLHPHYNGDPPDPLAAQVQAIADTTDDMKQLETPEFDIVAVHTHAEFDRVYSDYLTTDVTSSLAALRSFGMSQNAEWVKTSMYELMASEAVRVFLAQAVAMTIRFTRMGSTTAKPIAFNQAELSHIQNAIAASRDVLAYQIRPTGGRPTPRFSHTLIKDLSMGPGVWEVVPSVDAHRGVRVDLSVVRGR